MIFRKVPSCRPDFFPLGLLLLYNHYFHKTVSFLGGRYKRRHIILAQISSSEQNGLMSFLDLSLIYQFTKLNS